MKFSKIATLATVVAATAVMVPQASAFGVFEKTTLDNSKLMFEELLYNNQLNRYAAPATAAPAEGEAVAANDSISAFFTAYANIGYISSSNGFSGSHIYTAAFVTGAQMALDDLTKVGVAVNGSFGRINTAGDHITQYAVRPVAFFGMTMDEKIDIDAALAVGATFNDASFSGEAVNYNQYEVSAMAQAGYRFDQVGVAGLTLEPVVGLYAAYLNAGSADWGTDKFNGKTYYSLLSYVGGKAMYDFAIGEYNFTAEAYGYWKHEFAKREYQVYMESADVGSGWVRGNHFARDYAQFGLMATMILADNMTVSANWITNFSTETYDNTLAATFNMTF